MRYNVRRVRERKSLSQYELAKGSGVSRTTIIDIEAGHVRAHPRTIRKLAETLGVEPHELLTEDEEPEAA